MELGWEWRHARKRWAEILVIFEKDVSWDPTLGRAGPGRAGPVQLGATECAAGLLGQIVQSA